MTTNRERLTLASALLRESLASLDVSAHTCESCGLVKKHNWSEEQAATTIRGLVTKIERTLEADGLQAWLDKEGGR
jgi:hypothetical protein